ncbi:MAG: glycosyltransferase N-terminal domain-containing protein [Fibrobacteria bacterium]
MIRICLGLYRRAWILALPLIKCLILLDRGARAVLALGFLPVAWRVPERLGMDPGRNFGLDWGWGWGRDRIASSEGADGERRAVRGALWLHCASLGEAKGLWALADSLDGIGNMILTATTGEGAAYLAQRAASRDIDGRLIRVAMAPLDHPGIIRRFLAAHGVIGLCLYEVELWPNTLAVCKAEGLPVCLVSGRLTDKAARTYRRCGGAGARLLDGLAWIQAQSPIDAERFAALTRTEILIGSDFKAAHYLRPALRPAETHAGTTASGGSHQALKDAKNPEQVPERTRFAFVSLHLKELDLLQPGLPELMRRTDLIIFPRKLGELNGFRARLEPKGFFLHSRDPGARYLLVDSMGLIADRLPECHSALVGGSLIPLGCHNLWEPLIAGLRIHFGPYYAHQEFLAEREIAAGIAEVLADPVRIGTLAFPGPGTPETCRRLVENLRHGLDSALAEGRRRIIATFYFDAKARCNAGANAGGPRKPPLPPA